MSYRSLEERRGGLAMLRAIGGTAVTHGVLRRSPGLVVGVEVDLVIVEVAGEQLAVAVGPDRAVGPGARRRREEGRAPRHRRRWRGIVGALLVRLELADADALDAARHDVRGRGRAVSDLDDLALLLALAALQALSPISAAAAVAQQDRLTRLHPRVPRQLVDRPRWRLWQMLLHGFAFHDLDLGRLRSAVDGILEERERFFTRRIDRLEFAFAHFPPDGAVVLAARLAAVVGQVGARHRVRVGRLELDRVSCDGFE